MATNSVQLAAVQPVTIEMPRAGLVERLTAALREMVCGLRGHDGMLQFEDNRVLLRCVSCGHESNGWNVGERRPRLRFAGDARRHVLRRGPVLVMRKTA